MGVITIGRQYGSDGRKIAQELANRLGFQFYDKELIRLAAAESNIPYDELVKADEKRARIWAYPAENEIPTDDRWYYSVNDILYDTEKKIITEKAEKEDCVIVGRCADYILRENPECINVFICAEKKDRVARIAERYGVTEKKAASMIRKTDRERAFYYESHTGLDWGSIHSHQILFNVSLLGQDKIVDILEMMFQS